MTDISNEKLETSTTYSGSISTLDNPDGQPRTRRRRDLLKHYGIQKEAVRSDATPTEGLSASQQTLKKLEPLNINSKDFNSDLAITTLLKDGSIVDLLKKDNELISEIQQLDGDMKTLVYENYNKFISASDTVRSMKSQVNEMEAQMEVLARKTSEITSAASKINLVLDDKRAKIHKLSSSHAIISKLNFIFELPTKLKQSVQQKQYVQAVLYSSKTAKMLSRYRHLPILKKIDEECSEITNKIIKSCKEKLESKNSTLPEITEAVGLNIGLNCTPALELYPQYIELAKASLKRLVKSESVTITREFGKLSQSPNNLKPLVDAMTNFNETLFSQMAMFCECFDGFFLTTRDPAKMGEETANPKDNIKNLFWAKLPFESRYQAQQSMIQTIEVIESEYFQFIRSLLVLPNDVTKMTSDLHVNLLDTIHKNAQNYESFQNITKTHEHIQALITDVLGGVVAAAFEKTRIDFLDKCIISGGASNLMQTVQQTVKWLKDTLIHGTLPFCHSFLKKDLCNNPSLKTGDLNLVKDVENELLAFWSQLGNYLIDSKLWLRNNKPSIALVMARICVEISNDCLDSVVSFAGDLLYSDVIAKNASPKSGSSGEDRSQFVMKARSLSSTFRLSAQKLLGKYVEAVSEPEYRLTSEDLQENDWLSNRPLKVSPYWQIILKNLSVIEKEVGTVFVEAASQKPTSNIQKHRKTPSIGSLPSSQGFNTRGVTSGARGTSGLRPTSMETATNSTSQFDAVLSNIDRLFDERVEFYGLVDLNKSAVLSSICKVIIKNYLEDIRLQTFGQRGFQQIQLDSEYLRRGLIQFGVDEGLVTSLLNQVLSSVYKRCTDPNPLASGIIEPMLDEA